jgi:hypothetical protein
MDFKFDALMEFFILFVSMLCILPVLVAARSKAQVYGRLRTAIVGLNPTGAMEVCLLCVLLGRGLCDELITCPEESCRLWRVVVCDQETS